MEEQLQTLLDDALSCPVKWGFFSDGESLPRVSLFRMSGGRDHCLDGLGLMRGTIQIDCWGKTYAEAITASRSVRTALEGYTGGAIQGAFLTVIRDGYSDNADAAHRVSLTFAITHRD